jgi:hypothetical protein
MMKELTSELGFIWWQGVVEDRDDPLKLGRCRVRCVGFHTPDKTLLPTEDLPWAHPIMPVTSASMNGIGFSSTGLVKGSWVVGFFRDGNSGQQPVIMGSLGGIPQNEAVVDSGFYDPDGEYPKPEFIGEPDTNRLSRSEMIENTVIQSKRDDLDTIEISGAAGTSEVTEPSTPYASVYPFNKVIESESGHIIEFDDTEQAERLHIYHKSGTFIEIHPDGSTVRKVIGEDYEIKMADDFIHVKGDHHITVDGNANIYTKGNVNMKTGGNFVHEVIDGNYNLNVDGNIVMNAAKGKSTIEMGSSSIRINNSRGIYLN